MKKIATILVFFTVLCTLHTHAQKRKIKSNQEAAMADSLLPVREFIAICNTYKLKPLQMEMEVVKSSNVVFSAADTLHSQSEFYVQDGASFTRFANMEQLVSDGSALLVNKDVQRMVFYPDAKNIIASLASYTGLPYQDSSMVEIAKKYTTLLTQRTMDTGYIQFTSRQLLSGIANTPKESMEFLYNPKSKLPYFLKFIKKRLIPLSDTEYATMSENPSIAPALVQLADRGHFLIKEEITHFNYKKIEHRKDVKLPGTIMERVAKNENGNYIPIGEYSGYQLEVVKGG